MEEEEEEEVEEVEEGEGEGVVTVAVGVENFGVCTSCIFSSGSSHNTPLFLQWRNIHASTDSIAQ